MGNIISLHNDRAVNPCAIKKAFFLFAGTLRQQIFLLGYTYSWMSWLFQAKKRQTVSLARFSMKSPS